MLARAALLALLLSRPLCAEEITGISAAKPFSKTGYDELSFLGWNDACSCAIQYFTYPPVGEDLQGLPTGWRIGTLTIEPGKPRAAEAWVYASRVGGWDPHKAGLSVEALQKGGYVKRGFVEVIRPEPAGPRPGLDAELRSAKLLGGPAEPPWPPPPYSLRQIFYSPLATCALVVFRNERAPRESFFWRLIRVPDPGVRRRRSRWHLENALLLYEAADIYGGVEEAAIAAAMKPDLASARYHHARLLSTHGRFDEALAELEAAIRLDPSHKAQARREIEFRSVAKDLRFKALVR